MKKITVTILLLFLNLYVQAQTTYRTTEQRKQFYKKLVQTYASPAVKEIFETDTDNEFDHYVDGNSEQDLVEDYNTVIHELLHGYNTSTTRGNYYFIEPGIRILVPLTDVYRSKELNTFVRKGLQDSIFRYGIYVGAHNTLPGHKKKIQGLNNNERNEASSIQQGIYGLLEEFNAYYYGALAAYELYDYYLKKFGEVSSSEWKDYKHSVLSECLAYYEFNLFFAWYMVYAKEKYPKIYNQIAENNTFRVVFTLLQQKFGDLVRDVEARVQTISALNKPDIMDVLDFSGSPQDISRFLEAAGLTKEQLDMLSKKDLQELESQYHDVVKQLKNSMENEITLFHAQALRQIAFLKKLLTPTLQYEIDALLIKDLTTANYQSYLK